MGEEQKKLGKWLAYLKEVNIWETPRIAFAYLCDKYAEDSDTIVLYRDFLLSDIASDIVHQISDGSINAEDVYRNAKDQYQDRKRLACFINAICKAFGLQQEYSLSEEDAELKELPYKLTLDKKEKKKSAQEYYKLACAQKSNIGIVDTTLYIDYMSKASEMGHAQAMQCMARFYLKGKYVQQNESMAIGLYKKCAELKDGQSCYELYRIYKRKGIEPDKSLQYLKMAAEYGMTSAQYDLAIAYIQNGTEDDYRTAFSLFQKAGEKGDPCAYYQLALCYRYGRGVDKDMQQARLMLEKAAGLGHHEAKIILKQGVI